jgi:hypothetical protein
MHAVLSVQHDGRDDLLGDEALEQTDTESGRLRFLTGDHRRELFVITNESKVLRSLHKRDERGRLSGHGRLVQEDHGEIHGIQRRGRSAETGCAHLTEGSVPP